ncbi:MAG TPA: phage major capsid protein [Kofleriaceae bacterium]
MSNRITPGRRARLAALGHVPAALGGVTNRATTARRRVDLPSDVKVPTSADELAATMSDPKALKAIAADPDTLFSFVAKYGEQQQGEGTELHRTVAEMTQKALIDYLRDNEMEGVKRINLDPQNRSTFVTARDVVTKGNPDAPGAKIDGEFRSSAEFLQTIWHLNRSEAAAAKRSTILNAASSVVPADGGYLIPEVLRSQLLQLAMENAIVRPRAFNVPMESLRVSFPMIDQTTNSGSIFGGMIAYWTEEGATLTDASASFGVAQLEAKNLTGYSEVPNQLLSDSIISFDAFINRAWPLTIAWYEDLAFIKGSGAGEPLGFLGANNPAAIAVTAESGQPTGTIVWENVVKMFARMLPSSMNSAVWLASPDTFPELATMALSVGTGGAPVWLSNGAAGPPMTILGRPVIFTEKLNTLGTRGDLAFVDLSYYLVGDRQAMTADSSAHYKFANNKTAFRIIQRVDGRPWLQSAITPQNSGNNLSPFVELATR